jgi:hypothetical protein
MPSYESIFLEGMFTHIVAVRLFEKLQCQVTLEIRSGVGDNDLILVTFVPIVYVVGSVVASSAGS